MQLNPIQLKIMLLRNASVTLHHHGCLKVTAFPLGFFTSSIELCSGLNFSKLQQPYFAYQLVNYGLPVCWCLDRCHQCGCHGYLLFSVGPLNFTLTYHLWVKQTLQSKGNMYSLYI